MSMFSILITNREVQYNSTPIKKGINRLNIKPIETKNWQEELFYTIKNEGIKQISFVPDAGHSKIIDMAINDPEIRSIALTTEEEGVALSCGAWLGGHKSVLLMQSSGVGNCINMFSILKSCNFPFLTFVTMRGEFEEFNSWQVPMGSITKPSLKLMGFRVSRIDSSDQVLPVTKNALMDVFEKNQKVALLLAQKFIGKKKW